MSETLNNTLLLLNGLSVNTLERLSYKSNLGISLKRNLHYFPKEDLLTELEKMTEWYDMQEVLHDIAIDYRIKSMESIEAKYKRYFPNRQVRQVFNDILGFRAFCDDYTDVINLEDDLFRVVDMTSGKSEDDGYRGVHVYYQIDNDHYPIEIQFNTLYDRQLNNWLHDYLYKKSYPNTIGQNMRREYENGRIKNAKDFEEVLKNVLSDC